MGAPRRQRGGEQGGREQRRRPGPRGHLALPPVCFPLSLAAHQVRTPARSVARWLRVGSSDLRKVSRSLRKVVIAVCPAVLELATRCSRRVTEPRSVAGPFSRLSSRLIRASIFGTRLH